MGTLAQAKVPAVAKAIVTAGLRWAPLNSLATMTPVKTPRPQPIVITIQPALQPLVPLRQTLATTPSPNRIRIIVPMNSAPNSLIHRSPTLFGRLEYWNIGMVGEWTTRPYTPPNIPSFHYSN